MLSTAKSQPNPLYISILAFVVPKYQSFEMNFNSMVGINCLEIGPHVEFEWLGSIIG